MASEDTENPGAVGSPVDCPVRLPALTPAQQKAMRHILANGDDLAMKGKRWQATKVELYRMGLLRRRIGDWAWIPTEAAKQPNAEVTGLGRNRSSDD